MKKENQDLDNSLSANKMDLIESSEMKSLQSYDARTMQQRYKQSKEIVEKEESRGMDTTSMSRNFEILDDSQSNVMQAAK